MTQPKQSIGKNAALIGSGALGIVAFTFGAASIASAQDAPPALDPPPVEETQELPEGEDRPGLRPHHQAIIDQLVADGVITQAQADDADEVRAALESHHEARKAERGAAIAEAIGITVDELKAAKEAGTPLAEIAGENLPAVVDLFVANANARIDAALESGRLTADEAAEKRDGLQERIETRLENGGGFGRKGEGRRGSRRGDRPAQAAAVESVDA